MEKKKKDKRNVFQKIVHWYSRIPHKKPYLEIVTALLSIPVLISIILINYGTLRANKAATQTPTPTPERIIITVPGTGEEKIVTATPIANECIKELGPVSIVSPKENERITDNPMTVRISYQKGDYCAAVWSYRINGGRWSEYDDTSIAIYNPPQGNIKLELRVKSIVGSDEKILTRNFIYEGVTTPQITTASASAN